MLFRTIITWAILPLTTLVFGSIALLSALLRVRNDREGSIYEFCIRNWSRSILWVAGVRVVVHGTSHHSGDRRIIVANHLSLFDILVLAASLKGIRFVAKAELEKIPFFGRAAKAVGTIYVDRQRSKASVESLRSAAERIGEGASVIMFPEGTRGRTYDIRPFKKGPFVLAITARVPVVPAVIHGTIGVNSKGNWRVTPGRVDIHFLDAVSTDGLTYDDRDKLSSQIQSAMSSKLAVISGKSESQAVETVA